MYEAFYHLNTNPFRLTPDPEFCFSHSGYKTAREYLDYALRLGEGFIMIAGQPGTGKTTLAETFLKDLDLTRVSAERIAASGLEADDMLRAVAYAYGIEARSFDRATLRRRIQQHFIQQEHFGRRALLIIDEAQGLPYSALEELRLLADLQAGSRPLLQLFLVGQEKLRDLICMPEMEQFQQRIIATCHLKPLDLWETRAYVRHRLCQAGWKGDPVLAGAALLAIHQWSRGVPRQINKICNRLLLLGYGKEKHTLDKEDVQAISAEFRDEQLAPPGSSPVTPAESGTTRPMAEHEDKAFSVSELTLMMDSADAGNPVIPVAPAPVSRPQMHAATRQAQQVAFWRVQAAAKTRRERQVVKSSPSGWSSVSGPGRVCRRYGLALVRLFTCRDRLGGMALVVFALVVATLFSVGPVRFPGAEGTDGANLAGEYRALTKPSLLTHGERQESTAGILAQTGKQGLATQNQNAIPVATPEELPGDGYRHQGNSNAAVVEAATHLHTPDKVAIVAPSRVTRPSVEFGTAPGHTSDATHDGSEMTGPQVSQNDGAKAPSNRVIPNFALMDTPDAGDAASKMVPAGERPVPPPASREEDIASLLALGRQALSQLRLLTPADNNACHYFQKVLVLDPGNTQALDGLDQIAERYVTMARRANERGQRELTRLYISRGLRIQPGNRKLLALQDTLREPLATPQETTVVAPPEAAPQPQQVNIFSWLKSLFTRRLGNEVEVVDHSTTAVNPGTP
jgi:type II secretory pathway predicted ATPase ExeA